MNNHVVYDIETRTGAEEHPRGWDDIPHFGLALAVTWDEQRDFRTWMDASTLYDELLKFERIVTYNGIRFDNAVVAHDSGRSKGALDIRTFDILALLSRQLGYRIRLDQLAMGMGLHKTSGGDSAVEWWKDYERLQSSAPQKAQYALGLIEQYCRGDVELTREVYMTGVQTGRLRFERRGRFETVWVHWK